MPEIHWDMADNTTAETADRDATVKILAISEFHCLTPL